MIYWNDLLYQYFNKLPLGEATESPWKSKQHRLIPKNDIIRSLVPFVKQYILTMEEDDTLFKINYQHCNGFLTFKGWSGEMI